jgi:hypothetical protein
MPPAQHFITILTVWQVLPVWLQQPEAWLNMHAVGHSSHSYSNTAQHMPPAEHFITILTVWQVLSIGLQQPETWPHMHAAWHRLAVGPQQEASTAGEPEAGRHWLQVGAQQRAVCCQQRAANMWQGRREGKRGKAQEKESSQSVLRPGDTFLRCLLAAHYWCDCNAAQVCCGDQSSASECT